MILVLLVFIQCALSIIIPDIVINIRDGQIRGTQFLTKNKKVYYGFQGIPYARPPIGELRFEIPRPPDPWSGVLDTTKDSKACISNLYFLDYQNESEDCLYINVYTPSFMAEGLPVMFWIYGGDFVSGDSSKASYGPDFLVEQNVILVTFNYRLGPLGFLSTGDEVMPGNYGLKDQNLALKWTRENIAYFGGDPDKVTIFGQSAGGVSVALHLLSQKSRGLFRSAIIESASALVPWVLTSDPRSYAFQLAANAGYRGNDTNKLKMFLKLKLPYEIIQATDWIKLDWPVLEVQHGSAFITDYNYKLLESGEFTHVPTIIGMCSEESVPFLIDPPVARLEALVFDLHPSLLIPTDLRSDINKRAEIIQKIKCIYIKENETFSTNVGAYADFLTDNMFARGIIKHAQLQSVYNPVYFYQFAYYGRPFLPVSIDGVEKAGHSAELPFLFTFENFYWDDKGTQNLLVQNRMVKLWTNFAKYLNPTPVKTDLLNNTIWTPFNLNKLNYLVINDTIEMKRGLKEAVYSEWNDIFEEYGKKPFITY